MTDHQWKDTDPAMAQMQGMKLLEKLGVVKDQMIEGANIDIMAGGFVKLNVTYVLSVRQLKEMGVDLNA